MEIDGLPINSMVMFQPVMLVITRGYPQVGCAETENDEKSQAKSQQTLGPLICPNTLW